MLLLKIAANLTKMRLIWQDEVDADGLGLSSSILGGPKIGEEKTGCLGFGSPHITLPHWPSINAGSIPHPIWRIIAT